MAEVGQSIPHESVIGIVCSMEAKELRGRPGSKSGRVPAMLFNQGSLYNAGIPG